MREVEEEDVEINDKMPFNLRDTGERFEFYATSYGQLLKFSRVK